MVQTKRVTRSRATAVRDSPRPRRKAAARAAATIAETPTVPPSADGWNDETGKALVGASIGAWWPDDSRFYAAMVLSYQPRRRHHKIIYLEDETIESLELGGGSNQRPWERREPPADPLVGKDVLFSCPFPDTPAAWFDFMRAPKEKRTNRFAVRILSKFEDDPEDAEISSPKPDKNAPDADLHMYYRVIYDKNEYLATVDLQHVSYTVDGESDGDEVGIDLTTAQPQRSALPADTRRNGSQSPADDPAPAPAAVDDDGKGDDAYVPPGDDGADSDDAEEGENGQEDNDEGKEAPRPKIAVSDDDEEVPLKSSTRSRKQALMKTEGMTTEKTTAVTKKTQANVVEKEQTQPDEEVVENVEDVEDVVEKAEKSDPDEQEPEPSKDQDTVLPDVKNKVVADVEPELDPLPGLEDEAVPTAVGSEYGDGVVADGGEEAKPVVVNTEEADGSKQITVDNGSKVVKDPHSGMDVDKASPMVVVDDIEALKSNISRVKSEGSAGTQDTHDEPLDHGTSLKVESDGPERAYGAHDTASDEEKVGWVSKDQKRLASRVGGLKSQVGDYISLDIEDGKERRKAFVEAYLPGSDEHFVAFCDSEGGNLQLKLTRNNHTLLKDEEVDELSRRNVAGEEPASGTAAGIRRGKRRRNGTSLTLNEGKSKKKRDAKEPEIKGDSAGTEVCGRCLKIEWPGSDYVYTALVMGYNSNTGQHMVVYLSDHCVETVMLKYRDWNLIAREDEPWIREGMVGKRLYVFWEGEYTDQDAQKRAEKLFGEESTKVPYEAYVISYEGDGLYKVLYPATEDTEVRKLKADEEEGEEVDVLEKEWDILEQGVDEVVGLPIVTWSE